MIITLPVRPLALARVATLIGAKTPTRTLTAGLHSALQGPVLAKDDRHLRVRTAQQSQKVVVTAAPRLLPD